MAGGLARFARIGGVGLVFSFGLAGIASSQQSGQEQYDPASVEAIAAAQAELAELREQKAEIEAAIAQSTQRAAALRTELEGLEKSAAAHDFPDHHAKRVNVGWRATRSLVGNFRSDVARLRVDDA